MNRSDIIGKIMILSFSDLEEYLFEKIKKILEDENMDIIQQTVDIKRSFKELEIDSKKQLVFRNGVLIHMSRHEFLTLYCLSKNPGRVFSKKQIYRVVYGEEEVETVSNIIYCLIRNLRKKLEADPRHPKYIQTVRGVGYKFVDTE